VATRASQETKILTSSQALAFVERHGIVCESSRRGDVPGLAEAIVGAPIRGNWWSHPRARDIFALTRAVRDAPQVLVCRLIDGKITFVHERLWPALVRAADHFAPARLARLREVHSASGRHVIETTPFAQWVSSPLQAQAGRVSEAHALASLEPALV